MTDSEVREHEEFDAYLRDLIAKGEMTPDEANVEWDYHFNGYPSLQSIYG